MVEVKVRESLTELVDGLHVGIRLGGFVLEDRSEVEHDEVRLNPPL